METAGAHIGRRASCLILRAVRLIRRFAPGLLTPLSVAVAAGATTLLISAVSCVALYRSSASALEMEIRDELLRVARCAAVLIDADAHRTFTSPSQENSQAHRRALEPLRRMLAASPDYRYLYTCVPGPNGTIRFILDPTPPGDVDGDGLEEKSQIGQLFPDAPPALRRAMRTPYATAETRPYRTRWGKFIRGYCPIYDRQGRFVGIVVASLSADRYLGRIDRVRRGALAAGFCALSLSFIVGFAAFLLQRRVSTARAFEARAARRISEQNIELEKRERYLAAMVEIERYLLTVDPEAPDIFSVPVALLGPASGASRVYVFGNHRNETGHLFTSIKAEWCAPGIPSQYRNEELQNIPLDETFSRWVSALTKDEAIAGRIADFPADEREFLEQQEILSILVLPLKVDERFFGFIGFDNCEEARLWEDVEIDLLQAAATVLSQALERQQAECELLAAQDGLRRNQEELERRVVERTGELEDAVSVLTSTLEAVQDGVLAVDYGTMHFLYNARFAEIVGIAEYDPAKPISATDLIEAVSSQLTDKESLFRNIEYLKTHRAACSEEIMRFVDGRVVERFTQPRRRGNRIVGRIWSFRDVTQRRNYEEQLAHQAFHDALTDLPNRALFLQHLERSMLHSRRTGQAVAVLFVDLDNFKVINDSLGHDVGDTVLKIVAERITAGVRPGDTVARMGGDEFTILLDGLNEHAEAVAAAERIVAALREPCALDGREVYLSGSVGIACGCGNDRSAADLVRSADMAMYRAKMAGKSGYAVFNTQMDEQAVKRLELETALHRAIDQNELRVHYQPVMDLRTGAVRSVEALVRWQHPIHGLISPDQFIPIAEETGLIMPLGRWVLEESCRQVRHWHRRFQEQAPLTVSVNVSARQLQQRDLVEEIEGVIRRTGIEPRMLQLEITESVVMKDIDANIETLQGLRAMGVSLSVDDFGTGYSSMAYLSSLPIDTLKIDRTFIERVGTQAGDGVIVRAIVSLARALNLSTVSEGIETEEQRAVVASLGCDYGQGYVFAHPMSPADFEAFLAHHVVADRPDSSLSAPALPGAIAA